VDHDEEVYRRRRGGGFNVLCLVALVLGTVGGVRVYDGADGVKREGEAYLRVAAVFVFVQFVVSGGMLTFTASRSSGVMAEDRKLLVLAVMSVPLLFVRLVYSLCAAIDFNSDAFRFQSSKTVAIAMRAVLCFAMECLAVGLYIVGGLLAPQILEGEVRVELDDDDAIAKDEMWVSKEYDGVERGHTSITKC